MNSHFYNLCLFPCFPALSPMHFYFRHVASRRRRNVGGNQPQGITPLPSAQSEHDFHKFGVHPNSVAPGFHFHLAASINPETGM